MNVQEWLGSDNQLGIDIWERKYRYGTETFDQWLDRVSGGNEAVKQLIIDKKFLFGGRILSNRGLENSGRKVSMSNCYVCEPPEDNLESIFDCAKKLARTYSYGGGIGVDLSKLAPNGAKVRNAAKESSGAVSFMDLYSLVTGLISQNGRRGALMISMSCDHPDIEEFIDIKNDLNRVTKANISIRITDEFMNAVINDEDYELSFTRVETGEEIKKVVKAKELFHKIAKNNWSMGEPGMLFWDRIENWNLLSGFDDFHYAGTNPCAEEPLPAGGSCLLGSINLSEFVDNNGNFNFKDFSRAVYTATIALNEVLDEGLPMHPLKEQQDSVRDWRQIGLGIFGLADMLIKMGVKYGSDESIDICSQIAERMLNASIAASCDLAYDKDTFPMYDYHKLANSNFYQSNVWSSLQEVVSKIGLHNSQLLTIAPTGTLSTMLGVSGGIEPIFANYYTRKTESLYGEDKYYKVYTPIVQKYMDEHNLKDDSELPDYFVTAGSLNYKERIRMQATWQNYIDASISSTVNVPNEFSVEDVANLYIEAWKAGLKGITVFRDGCERAAILSTSTDTNKPEENNVEKTAATNELPRGFIIETNDDCIGKKRKLITGCGSLHVQAYFDPVTGDLLETFFDKGSTGGCEKNITALSRMISIACRAGVGIESVVDQLHSVSGCLAYGRRTDKKHDTSKGSSCPTAIGYALMDMWKEVQAEIQDDDEEYEVQEVVATTLKGDTITFKQARCPECGEDLAFEGGCVTCKACGWSKCS